MRRAVGYAACVLAIVVPVAFGGASRGWLDPSFGGTGVVRPTFGTSDSPARIATQRDGRIVVAATSSSSGASDFAVARYLRNGRLDQSFGAGGKVRVDLGQLGFDEARALAIQPDGKIVVAGWTKEQLPPYDRSPALVRLETDGKPDAGFGTAGRVVTDLGLTAEFADVATQRDGKIVVAGVRALTPSGSDVEMLVARFAADGSLDPTFGDDGWLVTTFPSVPSAVASAVAVQADGKIVVGGAGGSFGEPGRPHFDAAFVRYLPSGALEAAFGDGGRVLLDSNTNDEIADLLVQPDGRIVGAGTSGSLFAVARLTSSGSLDPSFGRGGKVLTGFTAEPEMLRLRSFAAPTAASSSAAATESRRRTSRSLNIGPTASSTSDSGTAGVC